MDLRELQESSKVGRIDVDIESEGGRSFGTVRIATGLDRAETAVLAAALETTDRVGPCRSSCEVTKIEDAREAKRREIVDRATELLAEFESERLTGDHLVEEVRERLREASLIEYRGSPAGPRVTESDAIIVVEGRADVRQLLSYGIKNVIAVEGTDIPDAVARLTNERTTTALLDGDRGGDLILRELVQVGDVDYVAFAPSGKSVEDLDRAEIMGALRKKLPHEQVGGASSPREAFAPTNPSAAKGSPEATGNESEREDLSDAIDEDGTGVDITGIVGTEASPDITITEREDTVTERAETTPEPASNRTVSESRSAKAEPSVDETDTSDTDSETAAGPATLGDHIQEVIEAETRRVRLLDETFETLAETPAVDAFDAIETAGEIPHTVVLDDTATQRLLDIAAQRGVGQIIATDTGEFVKQPTSVRVHAAEDIETE
jgi:DNA primase